MEKLQWETQKRKVKELINWEFNPRQISPKQVEQLTKSLEKFDLVEIPAIDTDNTIIAGHQRVKVLSMLGRLEDEIDVRVPNRKLTDDELREYNIRSNANTGSWDFDMLANQFDLSQLDQWGLDLPELQALNKPIEGLTDEDEVPEAPVEPKAKLGDIYQLGSHRVMCGDSTKIEDVEKLMNGEKADMVFTDPPYGMNLDTDYSKMGGSKTKYDKIIGDDADFDISFMFSILPSPIYYIWGAEYLYDTIPNFKQGSLVVWAKRQSEAENKVFGSAYELCWVFPKIKKEIWFIRGINQSSERLGVHPTQKPTELGVRAIKDRTEDGNIIADLFLGSGSTLIACEKINRKCYGMELDPKYVDVIIERWENFTGQKAVKLN